MRKVLRAQLHSNIFLGDHIGDLGNRLPPIGKSLESLEMVLEGEHILVKATKGGKTIEAVVPLTNVQVAVLVPATEEKPKK